MFRHIFTLVMILAGGTATAAVSPDGHAAITVEATNPSPVIGDSLTLIVTLSLPAGMTAHTPYLPVETPDIDILPHWEHADSTGMGATRKQFGLLAYVFRPDTLVAGPFMVDTISADGDTETVVSNPVTLLVGSVLTGDSISAMPNRGPVEIAGGFPWWIVVVALTVAGIAIFLIVRRLRKRREPEPAVEPPPLDETEVFRRIAAMRLYESGEYRRLYIMVSDALRDFIHRRMGYEARFRTTLEIRRGLSGDRLNGPIIPVILELLDEADMVKFARYTPPADEAAKVTDRAIDAVRRILAVYERERRRMETELAASAARKPSSGEPVGVDAAGGDG